MPNLNNIIKKSKQNFSDLPKVKIKNRSYYYDETKGQFIDCQNINFTISEERIKQANIRVERM